jgi:NAD(P)-dependent dehydrogenase (short-subunit alcohol dehydrogenase family)
VDLQGTSALVSGGASGLGAATCRALASRGAHVVAFDRAGDPAAVPEGVELVLGDVTDLESVTAAVDLATQRGELRVAVSCAGVGSSQRVASRPRSGAGEARAGDAAAFRRVIDINLIGTFHVMSTAAEAMARYERLDPSATAGVLVNTASIAAYEGQVGQGAYAASKAAVVALTFTAARDLAPLGIRVNAIAPGVMETPILGGIRDDVREGIVSSVVFPRRLGRPDEFAALVLHLVDNEYLNGETIRLDAATRLPHDDPQRR